MKRPLRHIIATVSLLLCALFSQAQEVSLREITKLYEDGHYEQCIRKALGYSAKHPNESLPYLMVAVPNLQLYFLSEGPEADDILHTAMQYALEAQKHDDAGDVAEPYNWEMNELYRVIRQRGNEVYNSVNKPTSAIYFKYLADIYGDTTDEYSEFFAKAVTPIVVVKEPEPVFSASVDMSNNVIKYAETLMGIHYRSSGTTPDGFDCSGYVRYVFAANNIDLPHSSQSMSEMGKEISLRNAQPGDLIFFGNKTRRGGFHVHHVGIVHGNDDGNLSFIHSSTSEGVTIDGPTTMSWDYWKGRILFVRRIFK